MNAPVTGGNPLSRWLAQRLGTRYPVLLRGIDGAITTFLIVFGGQLLAANVFDVHNVTNLAIYQQAALAGLAAVLSVLKSAVMTLITGQTALLGLASRQVRADRDRPPVRHTIPVRPGKATTAAPRRRRTPATPATRGAHEAPEQDNA